MCTISGVREAREKIGSLSWLDHLFISCITTIYHIHISLTVHYSLYCLSCWMSKAGQDNRLGFIVIGEDDDASWVQGLVILFPLSVLMIGLTA
jgi:hypothetical protein